MMETWGFNQQKSSPQRQKPIKLSTDQPPTMTWAKVTFWVVEYVESPKNIDRSLSN